MTSMYKKRSFPFTFNQNSDIASEDIILGKVQTPIPIIEEELFKEKVFVSLCGKVEPQSCSI